MLAWERERKGLVTISNEVEITIRAVDLTGPAFDSIMARLAAMKKLADSISSTQKLDLNTDEAMARVLALKKEIESLSFGHLDTSQLGTALTTLRSKIQSLGIADIADVNVQPGRIMVQLQLLKRLIAQAGISDILDINATTGTLTTQLQKLGQLQYDIPVNFNVGKFQVPKMGATQSILNVPTIAGALNLSRLPHVGPSVVIPLTPDIVGLESKLSEIPKVGPTMDIPVRFDTSWISPGTGSITTASIAEEGFAKSIGDVTAANDASKAGLDDVIAKIARYGSMADQGAQYNAFFGGSFSRLIPILASFRSGIADVSHSVGSGLVTAFDYLRAAISVAMGGGGAGGGGIAGATAAAGGAGRAFGFWGGILNGTIGGIKLWHVALDGALEATLALTLALGAFAVGAAAMVSTSIDIYNHIQAVNAVNSALGDQINVLGGQFRTFAEGVLNSSNILEIYGGALNLAKSQTGGFVMIAHEVVVGFDDWIAKIDIWSQSQTGMTTLLQHGVGFLSQFETIVNEVGVALSNLIKNDPGTAHMLLDVVGGAGKLLDVITGLPGPIVETGLALHSMYLWGSVLGGVLGKLPGPLGAIGNAIVVIAHNPALLLLAAAAFEMERSWDSASAGVVKDINAIKASLSQMTASQAISGISVDIASLNEQMSKVSVSSIQAGWTGLNGIWQESGDKLQAIGHDLATAFSPGSLNMHGLDALGNVFKDIFSQGAAESQAAVQQFQHDIGSYQNEINSLLGDQKNLFTVTGDLTSGQDKFGVATHNVAESLALLDLAGVQYTDSLPLMLQKVYNLVSGYQAMSVQGPLLAAAVNAVTFATELQQSKVGQLNSGWDTFIQTVSGGVSGFATFANQVTGLYQSLSSGGVKLSDSSGRVSSSLALLASTAGSTKVSMTGLNTASLNAQQTFVQSVTAANSQMDALTTLASAAGLGAKGTALLTQANKDLVSALLPAASQSSTMTTILYALAQRGGYTGADSFKALSQWVSNTANPMTNLQGIVGTLTKAAGNLTTDVQNLATALHQDLNSAMAQVILTETGGIKPMEDLYNAIATTGLNSRTTQTDAANLAGQFLKLTGNVNDAHGEFDTFATQALGLTKSQADTLWQKTLPALQKTIDGLHGKAIAITTPNAPNAKQQVLDLNNSIIHLQNHTSIVRVVGEGGGGVSVTAPGLPAGIIALHSISGAAGGMMVKGGIPGRDSVLIAAQQGEVVVPTNLVQAGAIDNLRGKIPGFSLGGMVGSTSTAVASDSSRIMENDTASVMRSMYAAVIAAEARAAAASAAQFVATQGASGGIIQSMMVNMAAARGWTGAQATALLEVEAREAGFNMTATNPTSGAYGLAQFINGPSEYAQYGGNATTASGQITGMLNYIAQRYGNPENAWVHELAYGWYDHGGWLQPGYTMAYNGTGKPEPVGAAALGAQVISLEVASGGSSRFESFMLEMIREFVRVKGGGNVQMAFGRNK